MTLDEYQRAACDTAVYPGQGAEPGLVYVALKLNGEAGEFAEHVGKAMRDDGFGTETRALTIDRHQKLLAELGDVLWYIAAAGRELGTSLDEIASMNLAKLASRKERGTLSGSGDNR